MKNSTHIVIMSVSADLPTQWCETHGCYHDTEAAENYGTCPCD